MCDFDEELQTFQDTMHRVSTYKYSRTTHFRNTVHRIQGYSRVPPDVLQKAYFLLEGYPDNHACHYTVLKASGLPYQHTSTIRRSLGYDVPKLRGDELHEISNMFEYFCQEYEVEKPEDRKNLPSLEYLIYNFLLYLGRDDIAALICKRYMTNEKEKTVDEIFELIMKTYSS